MNIGYFEKVIIKSSAKLPMHIGKIGIVLGISSDEEKIYSYSVSFPNEAETYSFLPEEIEGTGEFVDRSEIYDDEDVVRVRVRDGKSKIV